MLQINNSHIPISPISLILTIKLPKNFLHLVFTRDSLYQLEINETIYSKF